MTDVLVFSLIFFGLGVGSGYADMIKIGLMDGCALACSWVVIVGIRSLIRVLLGLERGVS